MPIKNIKNNQQGFGLVLVLAIVAVVGTLTLVGTNKNLLNKFKLSKDSVLAVTTSRDNSFEPELGTIVSPAVIGSDAAASGGQFVRF